MAIDAAAARGGDRAAGGAPRPRSAGDGAGDHQRRHGDDGAGDPGDLGAARPRPARLHAGRVRRGGPAPRGAAGARTRHPARAGAGGTGHPLRARPAGDRSADRLLPDAPPAADPRLARRDRRGLRRAGGRAPKRGSTGKASAREQRQLRRSVDLRYQGQNYELPVAAPDGALDRRGAGGAGGGFAQAHEQLYGYRSAAASRSRRSPSGSRRAR